MRRAAKQCFFIFLMLTLGFEAAYSLRPDSTGLDANKSAMVALAAVDSLLAEGLAQEAVALARTRFEAFRDNTRWSWQFENRLGVALLRTDQAEEALPLLENQVRLRTLEPLAHRNLGACLLALGRKGRALSEYQMAVELEPNDFSTRIEFGQLLLEFGAYEDSEQEILTAARLCGQCLEVQQVLARYYLAVGKPAQAVDPLKITWRETGSPAARRNLLKALVESGQDLAVLDLLGQASTAGFPRDEMQQLVAAEGRLGRTEQSLFYAGLLENLTGDSRIPETIKDDPGFWGQVSYNLMVAGLNPKALAAVDRAVELAPENVVYRNNRVVLLQRLGRDEEATREWQRVLTLDPSLKGNPEHE